MSKYIKLKPISGKNFLVSSDDCIIQAYNYQFLGITTFLYYKGELFRKMSYQRIFHFQETYSLKPLLVRPVEPMPDEFKFLVAGILRKQKITKLLAA